MAIDRELKSDIKKLVGDGSRAAKFAMLEKIDAANRELSSALPRTDFWGIVKRHGRPVVAVAVACTLYNRRHRLDGWGLQWAQAVLDLLPFAWTQGNTDRATIRDVDLHPTAICAYAKEFIKLTTEP